MYILDPSELKTTALVSVDSDDTSYENSNVAPVRSNGSE